MVPAGERPGSRRARIIGIISTSGGIGKTDDSMKEINARNQSALSDDALRIVQSYKLRIIVTYPTRPIRGNRKSGS